MLRASVPNVLVVSDGCCTCVYLGVAYTHFYVASVSSGCCICFHAYVSSVSSRCCICVAMATHVFPSCFKYMLQVFQLFHTYVTNVSSRCCKSRYGVAHIAVDPIYILYACGCGESANGKHWKPYRHKLRWSGCGTQKRTWDPREAGLCRGCAEDIERYPFPFKNDNLYAFQFCHCASNKALALHAVMHIRLDER
jgi:hypothetical protein